MSCKFCGPERERVCGVGDSMEFALVDLYPVPALNLTTGELERNVEPPFCELFVYWPDEVYAIETLGVRYCPMCGELLRPKASANVRKILEAHYAKREN